MANTFDTLLPLTPLEKPVVEDSFKKRYAYKLFTNISGIFVSAATQLIIPRSLGAAHYGNFNFLTTFFGQTFSFFDSGISAGFYAKLSRRPKDYGLIRFNWGVLGMISSLVLIFVAVARWAHLDVRIWPHQSAHFIWLAALWVCLVKSVAALGQMIDAYGLTVSGELIRLFQSVITLAVLSLLFFRNQLHLTEYFLCQYVTYLILGVLWLKILADHCIPFFPRQRLKTEHIKAYGSEFFEYASPLMMFSLISLTTNVFDRWFLQKYAGAVQQGFYSLSYQVGAICFLFSGAMTPLLMREFSKAFGAEDKAALRTLFLRHIPPLYAISAFFGIFCAFQAEKIGLLVGGNQFRGAGAAIAIMSLYPIHQTYGQLSGSLYYATDQLKTYRNISIVTALLGTLLTIKLIGPSSLGGLDLGSIGLAIKMITVQFLAITAQLWFNARYLNISFIKLLMHQFYCAGALALLAGLSSALINRWIPGAFGSVAVSGLLYSVAVIGLVSQFPGVFALSRSDTQRLWQTIRRTFAVRPIL